MPKAQQPLVAATTAKQQQQSGEPNAKIVKQEAKSSVHGPQSAITAEAVSFSNMPPNWTEMEAKYKQDIEALTESTEMATIEKEIAEEKLDNCERELQQIKDKLAEAMLQIDMLKGQQEADQSLNASNSGSAATVFQLQKVEEQNELLKQALIKLRDISAKDKRALEDLQIQHEDLQEKLLDLEEKEQKYIEKIKIYEEQIDVSQSAQEMVEKLTQQKAELEDKLRDMVDDFDNMEKLRDLNEQLLESARENEIELTGELDKMRVQYSELSNRKRDIEDYLTVQEQTVAKLKDENRTLTEQLVSLKNQFKEGESIEQQKHQIENVAYKLNFSETKMAEKEAEITRYKRNLAEMEEQMSNLSLITKEQSAKLDELKLKYEAKVAENSDLQRSLKKRMEEVSELEIRREMAEKKLQAIQRETETKLANLNRTIETMKGMEVQHEEDIKRLMEDNELIERERRELRDQLNKSNRSLERSMQTGASLSMVTAQDTSLASLGISLHASPSSQQAQSQQQQQTTSAISGSQQTSQSSILASAMTSTRHVPLPVDEDESVLLTKIKELSRAFDRSNRRNQELEMELAFRELNNHAPPYCSTNLSQYYDIDRAKCLRAEIKKLKREVRSSMINQRLNPKSRNIYSQNCSDNFSNSRLALKYQMLENEASAVLSSSSLAQLRPQQPLLQSTPVK